MALRALIWIFLKIGALSFGGGYVIIPLIQTELIENRGWLSFRQLTDIISISQITPGPVAINAATFTGYAIDGFSGAVGATLGCALPGTITAFLLYRFFKRDSIYGREILKALKAAAVGLIAAAAGIILPLALSRPEATGVYTTIDPFALSMFIASFIVLRLKLFGPLPLLFTSALIGYFYGGFHL